MNNEQIDFSNSLKSIRNADTGDNEGLNPQRMSTLLTVSGKPSEKQSRSRLKELVKLNGDLEKLVEQRTRKLIEVVATNNKFISIIAHDLRSPFTSIIGVLDTLKDSLNDFTVDDIEKLVKIASDSANRTLNLLDNLLAWTISQNKEKNLNPVKINLFQLLKEEIESFSISSKYKQIRLNYHIAPDLNATADIQMIKTILRNLISNAIKFTHTGGEITIRVLDKMSFVEIAVEDNGIGISDEARQGLFSITTHHTSIGTGNEQGTGLGLILCKEFVEMHGGTIWVESEPGRGSKFFFTIPQHK
jgi:signal transduction histidine kinase